MFLDVFFWPLLDTKTIRFTATNENTTILLASFVPNYGLLSENVPGEWNLSFKKAKNAKIAARKGTPKFYQQVVNSGSNPYNTISFEEPDEALFHYDVSKTKHCLSNTKICPVLAQEPWLRRPTSDQEPKLSLSYSRSFDLEVWKLSTNRMLTSSCRMSHSGNARLDSRKCWLYLVCPLWNCFEFFSENGMGKLYASKAKKTWRLMLITLQQKGLKLPGKHTNRSISSFREIIFARTLQSTESIQNNMHC